MLAGVVELLTVQVIVTTRRLLPCRNCQLWECLVLTRSGSSYITNAVDGFTFINDESRYSVANDTRDNL